jgi:SagB-type dehydrogenase family enzyme
MASILELSAAVPPAPGLDAGARYRLSRHCCIRPGPRGLVLESALAPAAFPVSPSVSRLLLALAQPVLLGELLASVDEPQRPAVLRLLERFRSDGLLSEVDSSGVAEDEAGSLAHWEPHDLMFHARSRRGRSTSVVGATFHLEGVVEPEPVLRPPHTDQEIALEVPDLGRLAVEDLPFTAVLEARRSRYDVEPLERGQVAEFLYRTFRVTGTRTVPQVGEVVRKVYPSGGSLHSLELYLVPWAVHGLERAVYHYRPDRHALVRVTGFGPDVEPLLHEARTGTGNQTRGYSPLLLVVTARFRRVMWKYQGLSYRVILQETGALYQTMYLVATAMGVSACAVGTGDSDRFARVAGLDYHHETSVGEFLLGGRPRGA